jgi:hypothetical protein
MKLETLAIHAGQHPDPASGAVMTPIVLSSTFAQQGPGHHKGYEYSRSGNPTRNTLEACAAALEGGEARPRLQLGLRGHHRPSCTPSAPAITSCAATTCTAAPSASSTR